MKPSRSNDPNSLAKYALLGNTVIAVCILGVIAFTGLAENIKMALGATILAQIVTGSATLLNFNHRNSSDTVQGDKITVDPPKE